MSSKIEKQIRETKNRLRNWWQDPKALGRPIVLCNRMAHGLTRPSWEYFRYARMIIELLGNESLKPKIKQAMSAPYKNIPELPKAPTGWKLELSSPDHANIINQVKDQIASISASIPYGDSVPILRSQAGAGFPGCCMGEYSCIPITGPKTIWYETPRRWEEIQNIELDTSSPWWQFTMGVTKKHLERAPEWVSVGFPSMSGPTDILQMLRGGQNLLRDMIKEKEKVKNALDQLSDVFNDAVNKFWAEISKTREGSGSFIGIWAPGNAPSVQCDALSLIGPRQFKKFALPYIKKDLENADYGTYHLDGPLALKFVNDLLEIPELDLIQWVEGYGNPDGASFKWYPLVKKVLRSGKRIILYTGVDRIPPVMKRLKSDGIHPSGIAFSIGNIRDFEIKEFIPWIEDDSGEYKYEETYDQDFWDNYQELIKSDKRRYDDLYQCDEEIELDYK